MKKIMLVLFFVFVLSIILFNVLRKPKDEDVQIKANNVENVKDKKVEVQNEDKPALEKVQESVNIKAGEEKNSSTTKNINPNEDLVIEKNDIAQEKNTPDVIPIELAERYFIPKEQRGPGNIGGPPALPFIPGVGGGSVEVTPPAPSFPTAPQ